MRFVFTLEVKVLGTTMIGLPPGTRALIVNADDFGSRQSTNTAIKLGLQDGILSSTSLMVPCPWAFDAMAWLREHPEVTFAVHLTLVRDFDSYRWGPVAGRDAVASLVDANGHFPKFDGMRRTPEHMRLDDIEREFRAQIETVFGEGLAPTNLDWHSLPDGGSDEVFDLTFRLAREYAMTLRVHTNGHRAKCKVASLPTADHPMLDSYSMPSATKLTQFSDLLRTLPSGITEWAIHPGADTPESRAVEPDSWQIRALDLEFVLSAEARQIVADEGIALLSYRDVLPHWTA